MIAFGFALALAGVILLISGAAQAAQNRSYVSCSGMVTGRVTRKQSRNVKNGKAHELTVSYTVDGTVYEKVVGALLTKFQAINEGDEIELRYKPDNPKKAVRPETMNPQKMRIVLMVGTALLVTGIALLFGVRLVNI